jgi:hypothetical protein
LTQHKDLKTNSHHHRRNGNGSGEVNRAELLALAKKDKVNGSKLTMEQSEKANALLDEVRAKRAYERR